MRDSSPCSQELRINPNTAHKVVATLVGERLLEVKRDIGTVVARAPAATRAQRMALLRKDLTLSVPEGSIFADDRTH